MTGAGVSAKKSSTDPFPPYCTKGQGDTQDRPTKEEEDDSQDAETVHGTPL